MDAWHVALMLAVVVGVFVGGIAIGRWATVRTISRMWGR